MTYHHHVVDAIRALEVGDFRNHVASINILPGDVYEAHGTATGKATRFSRV